MAADRDEAIDEPAEGAGEGAVLEDGDPVAPGLRADEQRDVVVPLGHHHGRGVSGNPRNRFESRELVPGPDWDPNEDPAPAIP